MTVYLATFGYCIVSALFPLANAEAYLLGVATLADRPSPWLLAGVAAVGQVIGKVVYYYVGRGSLRLPSFLGAGKRRHGRWAEKFGRWRQKIEERPSFGAGLVLLSAFVGLPPIAVVSVFAGVVRVPLWLFVPLGLVGRYARFAVLLLAPGVWRYLAALE